MEITTNSTQDTKRLAEQLAKKMHAGQVIALYGDLGAGKTTFSRYLVESLGGVSRVQSPTFVIARKYLVANSSIADLHKINHLDLYRLKSQDELADLDLSHFFHDPHAITLVEWPHIAEAYLPENSIIMRFEYINENSRKIYVENID